MIEKILSVDIEKLILELAKQGMTAERIGLELKNKSLAIEGKISAVLKKHNLYQDPDVNSTKSRLAILKKHWEKNKNDKIMKKAMLKAEAKLLKISKSKDFDDAQK